MKDVKTQLRLAILICISMSCNREKSIGDLLQNKTWYWQSFSIDGEEQMSGFADCQKDNLLTFSDDNLVITNEGNLKCEPNSRQIDEHMYSLSDNGSQLNIEGLANYEIVNLTDKNLVTRREYNFKGEQVTEIITYAH
ncbi:MAG: lipocalin family protein [Saprospiraceae bacterium]